MGKNFLDLAQQGENAWWRYLLSFFIILFGWLGLSIVLGVLLVLAVTYDNDPKTFIDLEVGQIVGVDPLIILLISLLGSVALVVSLFVTVRFVHQRPILSLITPQPHFDWKRFALGFGFFLLLVAVVSLVEAMLYPGRYQLTFNANEFLKFLPVLLIFLPFQSAAEELLFRGYLMQSIGLITRRSFIPAVISSLTFMLLHLANPEVSVNFILLPAYYFGVGLLLALVTLKDNRLELAIGAHVATNLYAGLLANYTNSVLSTPAIFTVAKLDATYTLVSFIVIGIIFYAGLFLRKRKENNLK
jgi:membrane protease YdiL (CAAX protease family)